MTRLISSIPFVGSAWNRLRRRPVIGTVIENAKLRLKYGTAIPEFVRLPNSGAPMFLNRFEPRARGMLVDGAAGQPGLKRLWHEAIFQLSPDLALDIGVNYGEFILGERYPDHCHIFGIEANSTLKPFLDRSVAAHPDCERMRVKIALAAELSNQKRKFFIDPTSSGRSSVIRHDGRVAEEHICPTLAVDDVVLEMLSEDSVVVFKIDVEGFEVSVMKGMTRIIEQARQVFGFIEFNSDLIVKAGASPEEFLEWLASKFHIALINGNHRYELLPNVSLANIRAMLGSDNIEADLVLMSDPSMTRVLEAAFPRQ